MKFEISSLHETRELGRLIGAVCMPGDIICLGGELGAGKTTLAQAVIRGAGVADDGYITSPTFSIMHEYEGRMPIYHMDFYRLGSGDEVIELGLDEYIHGDGLSLIEWFERAEELIPASRLTIHLSFIEEDSRLIELSCSEDRWQILLDKIAARFGE